MPGLLLTNVRVFDGVTDAVSAPSNVLISGTTIERISVEPIVVEADTTVVDGGGRVLMPGLIDAHWHTSFVGLSAPVALTADVGYIHLVAGREAERALLRGFTTVRDCGGPSFALKRAIDEGIVPGPRIFPSGAMISQTSGHGDFRARHEVPRDPCSHLSHGESIGGSIIADGVTAVLRAAREQLLLGASQIKVMAGGGVSSTHDPLDVTQYTEPEVRAAVDAAENWGTYVMVHAYTPRAVQQAIRAGVKSIEHGHLLDEATVAMMAEHDVWWSLQPFLESANLPPLPPANLLKRRQVNDGTESAYALAIQHGVKVAWGTDILFEPKNAEGQGQCLVDMTRWYSSFEALRMATSRNAELMAMSGPRNPYPGELGVVTEGALADLLLVDGNPLENIALLADPAANLKVIIKDGAIVKNTL